MAEQKPSNPGVTVRKDGPYLVTGDVILRREGQEPLETRATFALCRCGHSSSKPFCDGTHKTVGFDGTETADQGPAHGRSIPYAGGEVTIHDDRSICAHAGVCTDNLPGVWKYGEEPWIDPDGAEAARIIAVVQACPSGALSYTLKGGEAGEESGAGDEITVLANGPYALKGGMPVASAEGEPWPPRARMTLCRCGASKNKPFCDGSHWEVKFTDPAE